MKRNIEDVVGDVVRKIKDMKNPYVSIFHGHSDEQLMDISPIHKDGNYIVWIQYTTLERKGYIAKEEITSRHKNAIDAENAAHRLYLAFKIAAQRYPNIRVEYETENEDY